MEGRRRACSRRFRGMVGDAEANRLAGPRRVAIIAGAGRGMGAAAARELAARGYRLAVMSPSGAPEVVKAHQALGLAGSVSNPGDLQHLVEATVARYGRIDAVVNSTGHPATGKLLDISDADWLAGVDLLLLNVVRRARLVTPVLLRQGRGAIVNISTFSAFEPSLAFPVSSALRAALGSFTKLYADAYAADGIRMNNLLPGFIESYPVDGETLRRIPMGRAGTLDEIAKTIAFLVSDDAGYITGQNLRVDGGMTRSV
jgi:NAD(P)-dependent dehydrogenase (short-subunit alcohol dehydrogenase family)